mmetsp:Transcript_128360/g.256383  ORF Transcript_128360/g.256383 Transcript_128360/m.256383 type:complete len:94 (+) Transcript_128360:45-326(+)
MAWAEHKHLSSWDIGIFPPIESCAENRQHVAQSGSGSKPLLAHLRTGSTVVVVKNSESSVGLGGLHGCERNKGCTCHPHRCGEFDQALKPLGM